MLLWGSSCSQGDTWHLLTLGAVSHIPEEESQELGMAQHSLATLADGVLQTLGCSSSPLKCSSGKMQKMQVSRENLSLFCTTRNLCEITHLCKTHHFTCFRFSSLSPFPCSPAYDCSFKSYVQLINQVFLDLPFVLCTQTFWI